jgi:hypothetical protein
LELGGGLGLRGIGLFCIAIFLFNVAANAATGELTADLVSDSAEQSPARRKMSRRSTCALTLALGSPTLAYALLFGVGADHATPNANQYVPVVNAPAARALERQPLFDSSSSEVSFAIEDGARKAPAGNFFGRNWRQEMIARGINRMIEPAAPGEKKEYPGYLRVAVEGITLRRVIGQEDDLEVTLVGEKYAARLKGVVSLRKLEMGESQTALVSPPAGSIPGVGKASGGGHLKFTYDNRTGVLKIEEMFTEMTVTILGHEEYDSIRITDVIGNKAQIPPKQTYVVPGQND